MSRVSTYLNFDRNTEEAFNFYKEVFGTEFDGEIMRFGTPIEGQTMDVNEGSSDTENKPREEDKNLIMHVSLPILGGHRLMGTDAPESMGFKLIMGNNVYINLEPDTKEEADELFAKLSEGGKVESALKDEFWGGYFGSCTDKFGVQWMFNVEVKK